jgi:hypothetical protein
VPPRGRRAPSGPAAPRRSRAPGRLSRGPPAPAAAPSRPRACPQIAAAYVVGDRARVSRYAAVGLWLSLACGLAVTGGLVACADSIIAGGWVRGAARRGRRGEVGGRPDAHCGRPRQEGSRHARPHRCSAAHPGEACGLGSPPVRAERKKMRITGF